MSNPVPVGSPRKSAAIHSLRYKKQITSGASYWLGPEFVNDYATLGGQCSPPGGGLSASAHSALGPAMLHAGDAARPRPGPDDGQELGRRRSTGRTDAPAGEHVGMRHRPGLRDGVRTSAKSDRLWLHHKSLNRRLRACQLPAVI
jgi:hypothetical protein